MGVLEVAPGRSWGLALRDGTIIAQPSGDHSILYYAPERFENFPETAVSAARPDRSFRQGGWEFRGACSIAPTTYSVAGCEPGATY
jgi:hypothetical protein